MAEAESLRDVAHARAPLSTWIGIVLLFLLFGVIVLALVGPSVRTDDYEKSRAQKRTDFLKGLREEDAKTLTTYGMVDKASGSVHIPIDRAMQLTVVGLSQQKPASAYPVALANPAPAAAASSAPTGAVSSSSAAPAPSVKPKETEGPQSEIHGQPAAAANPPAAKTGTQPGRAIPPAASPGPSASLPAVQPSATPNQSPPGSPLPVAGQTPPPAP